MKLTSGMRLGPYEVIDALGAGGMGEVYRARDTRLGRGVALKVIRSPEGADSEARRRFRREAEAASKLTHPNVCTLYDVGAEGDVDYLVLELLDGPSLAQRLLSGPLATSEALRIAMEIADALTQAHELGMVHRDLKPANVVLTATGAKLLDFGLARLQVELEGSRTDTAEGPLTIEGGVLGTPPYMSPEQATGRVTDFRSDQFSFGAVLFEMLTGRSAFARASLAETLSAVLNEDPLATDAARAVPAPLQPLLHRLLAKESARRFASTREMALALRALHRTAEGTPTSVLPRPLSAPRRKLRAGAALAVVLAVAGLSIFVLRARANAAIDSIAILPFATSAPDPDVALLADGVTQSLINGLAELPGLRVMALSSVTSYKGKDADPRDVGRALNVACVLTGRFVQRGAAVSISVALANARDGSHLWGDSYERPAADVLSLQSEIARELGRKLRTRLSGVQDQRLARPATEDREAYVLFLKGARFRELRTREALLRSIEMFRQALDRDSGYARAWAGLALSYDVQAYSRFEPPREMFKRARDAANRALALDPALSEPWAVLGHVALLDEHDVPKAETGFKKAIALNPSAPDAHHWYSHLLLGAKRFDESLVESRRALALDPLSLVMNMHLAEHFFFTGDPEAAISQLGRTLKMGPGFGVAHAFLGRVLESVGRRTEAISELEEAARLTPDSGDVLAQLGAAYVQEGRRQEAESILARCDALERERYLSPIAMAILSDALGDEARARKELERALREGDLTDPAKDVRLGSMRKNPRYRDLLPESGAVGTEHQR
ncbi:MAG: protein kinase [Thermoanaerobaculia bacterium]